MIKMVTVTNHLGESLELDPRNPEKSGFFIRDISGLGPSRADINTTDLLSNDGAVFNSARTILRNIIFNLGFMFQPTIEDVRQKSYKYFPVKKNIVITVETDNRKGNVYGYVESNDPDIFSAGEGASISIVCPDPYFYSLVKTSTNFNSSHSLFEFPFSNESLTEKLIEFGDIVLDTQQSIFYEGDADVGIVMYIHLSGAVGDITLYNVRTHESMAIDVSKIETIMGSPLTQGDDIIISTIKGDKYIRLLRSGLYTNIINALDKDADWFQIQKGDNIFTYTVDSGISNFQLRIENLTVYGGI